MDIQFDLFDSVQNRILESSSYEEFKRNLESSNCRNCPLKDSRTRIVVDRGSPTASIMVIGEGPGENEDRQGKAFVGRAGQLMDRLVMEELGLDTDRDFLIANVVKCRPPENRSPQKVEAQACMPFLKKQIALVHPDIIVLLGATALKHLSPSKSSFSMEQEAGKLFTISKYPGIQFMVLYHPAYLLYDRRKEPDFRSHLRQLKNWLAARGKKSIQSQPEAGAE